MQGPCRFPIHPTLSVVERQVTRVDATVLSHSWRLRSWTTLKILRDPTGALKHIPRAFHSACAHEITHLTSIERHAKTKLWEQASSRDCAPLACLNEYSLVWLNVCTTSAHVGLDCPTEFCVLSFFFPGRAHPSAERPPQLRSLRDHLLCCRRSGFIQRQQAVVQHLWRLFQAAGFNATSQVAVSRRARPSEILLPIGGAATRRH